MICPRRRGPAGRRGAGRRRSAPAGLCAAGLVLVFPATAFADTSTATATAVDLNLLGSGLVTSGTETATSDGTSDVVSRRQPQLSGLGGQSIIQTGSLVQTAEAFANELSAGCAGIVGNGGSVQIAQDGSCTVDSGTGGIRLNLGGLVSLTADAIIATCTATSSTGATTGATRFVNAKINSGLTGNTLLGTLNSNPAPNTSSNLVPAVAQINVNTQSPPAAGEITVRALRINLVSGLADVSLAGVTCGPNVATAPAPAVPWRAIPLFVAVILLAAVLPPGRRLVARTRTALGS